MTDDDKRCIKEIFGEQIKPLQDDLKKYSEETREVRQTVYGSDGQGGLRQVLSMANKEIDELKTFRTQVKTVTFTVIPMVQAGITIVVLWIKSLINGKG
jgi:hypothetical protein